MKIVLEEVRQIEIEVGDVLVFVDGNGEHVRMIVQNGLLYMSVDLKEGSVITSFKSIEDVRVFYNTSVENITICTIDELKLKNK